MNASCNKMTLIMPDGRYQRFNFQPGPTLLEIFLLEGYPIRSICGGPGGCGQCKVQVSDNYSMLLMLSEQNLVSKSEAKTGWRLACQIRPRADMTVHITQSVVPAKQCRSIKSTS